MAVVVEGGLAEVRRLADVPQTEERRTVAHPLRDAVVARQAAQHPLVESVSSEALSPGRGAGAASGCRSKLARSRKSRSALRHSACSTGSKRWRSTASASFGVHVLAAGGDAECAIALEAAGAAGDLADLVGEEWPAPAAVELGEPGEGHMVDVHVEAHADGIGGDQEARPSPDWKSATWAFRVRGLSEPMTTAAPPRWRRISSAMA